MKQLLVPLTIASFSLSSLAQNYPVGHRTITYNDPARSNRAIECEIYYPGVSAGDNVATENGAFPIIVFGHGFAMQTGAYPNFWNEFVPDGYIMVFPTTEGSFLSPNHGEFGADLQFLVNEMQAENSNNSSPFFQHVAPRSAIMGHSMGGGATILGASGFSDVDCIVGLAPAETDPSAITAAANVSAPALILSGSSDGVTPPDDHHIPIYNALGSSCKYFVSIENGSHCHFASNTVTCTLGEIIPGSLPAEDQRQVSYAVLHPWFDYFLQDECSSWNDFQTALVTETNLGTINSSCANDAPVITENNGTLESTSTSNYQWYLNGSEINGATQQTYDYTLSGTYQVGTTILGSCPTLSNEIVITITGIREVELNIVNGDNALTISSKEEINNATVDWFDLSGKVIRAEVISIQANGSVALSKPNTVGIKLLRLKSNSVVKTWRLW